MPHAICTQSGSPLGDSTHAHTHAETSTTTQRASGCADSIRGRRSAVHALKRPPKHQTQTMTGMEPDKGRGGEGAYLKIFMT